MLAEQLAGYSAARNIHYGWVTAALAFLYILFSSSALGITAVLIRPMFVLKLGARDYGRVDKAHVGATWHLD
jgi:hypothetical protein